MPLFIGGKLVIAPNKAHTNPEQMANLVKKHQVSVLQLVPSMLKEMLATNDFHYCTSLQHVFCGGEALHPETIKLYFEHNSSSKLHNLYGPTETTIDATTLTCTEEDGASNVILIGKPIMNTLIYILDNYMQPVPPGITGELYISGMGLARGYLNNRLATEEKFIENPFNHTTATRLYKTGDLGKWNSKGMIEYHGRGDHQVKIRGYRIELDEVELSIEKISHIHQCIVVPEVHQNESMSLSAYLVMNNGEHTTASDIRSKLNTILPEHMIPNRFFIVDHLLTTSGGKLDRKNIPKPINQLGLAQNHREPRNELEQALQTLWCSALKIESLGIDDDFFNLGGNSLSAMKIISSVKEQYYVNVTIRTIFEYPTIYALAKAIETLQNGLTIGLTGTNNSIVPLKESGRKTPLFLVHPVGGSVFWYKHLGRYLDKNQPLYGIQDPGLHKHDFIFDNLEEMASAYIGMIKIIQPHGPYLLGGASFGTTVAIEMAKQLQEQNEIVTAILSFDGWASYPSLQHNKAHFNSMMKEQNARLLKNYMEHDVSNAQFLLELQWHREQMLNRYHLPMIDTKFILFKATELTELFKHDADWNWWEHHSTKPIQLFMVPGDHESMFSESNIQALAAEVNKALNEDSNILDKIIVDSLVQA